MTTQTIGYVNRPTRDGRTLTGIEFPDEPVPIMLNYHQGQVGTAAGFAVDDEGKVTCETGYPLSEFDCMTMQLDGFDMTISPRGEGQALSPRVAFRGALCSLMVCPLYEWPWDES